MAAPSALESPIPRSLIVVAPSLFGGASNPLPLGWLALLSRDGSWRSLSPADLGLASINSEVGFALDDSGAWLAVGDRRGIVVVDLPRGTYERIPIPLVEPIGIRWSPDGQYLLAMDRAEESGGGSLLIDVDTRRFASVPYDAGDTAFTAAGTPVEVSDAPRGRGPTTIRLHTNADDVSEASVELRGNLALGPEADELLAVLSIPLRRTERTLGGVLVLDPTSAEPVALLAATGLSRTYPLGWFNRRTVLVASGPKGHELVSWNYETGVTRSVADLEQGPWNISASVS